MTKQTKSKEELRRVGPKFARNNVLPQNFQIRRPSSPMADLLDATDELSTAINQSAAQPAAQNHPQTRHNPTPVNSTPVKITPVNSPGVEYLGALPENKSANLSAATALPSLSDFLDRVLPRFPPARQALMLRLYRWSDGSNAEMIVSTPKLAAHTNMDEKSCRTHLHALIADGYLVRSADGEQIAKFGGSDRAQRGLLLRLSGQALQELMK